MDFPAGSCNKLEISIKNDLNNITITIQMGAGEEVDCVVCYNISQQSYSVLYLTYIYRYETQIKLIEKQEFICYYHMLEILD